MLLIDMKDVNSSVEVYKKASVLPDIESNSNFVSLKNKLQNVGGIWCIEYYITAEFLQGV